MFRENPPVNVLKLLLFCRAPRPGTVKTRLIPMLGEAGATSLYRDLLEHTLRQCEAVRNVKIVLSCEPDGQHPFFRSLPFEAIPQRGADLGERMLNAFDDAGLPALLIGADCPGITTAYLESAFEALKEYDAVLGPAEDGGYGLIGLQQRTPEVFSGVAWGTGQVAGQTRGKLQNAGRRYLELPLIWDVDRPADVKRWRDLCAKDQP